MNTSLASTRPNRPKVVVVEDDPGVRRSMQLLLQGQGFETRSYASGEALLADDGSRGADCLVVDYRLNGVNGIDLLLMLRQAGWAGRAILVTAFPSEELSKRATDSGYNKIFEKPLRERSLVEYVCSAVAGV